jgi:periplasmic copper chaperone A
VSETTTDEAFRMRPRTVLSTALLILGVALTAACSTTAASGPTVADAWARPGLVGAESAAYLTITNPGSAPDALVSISSPDAKMAQLHETSTDASGMTGMQPVTEISIPAGGSVALKPGSFHVMLMGLQHDLSAGGTLELQLVFRQAGKLTVQATIREP